MANRLKEDEKNERIIRGLLKLPANRRCINCNSLGPQYVCTNFWTFVCTTCSGMHREFTHRVKSVSMAKFNSEEVNALMGGGNERAREIYFKEWDPHRHSLPDNSNTRRLRDFIKHVYVDRKYSGEKSTEMTQRIKKMDTKLDPSDVRDALRNSRNGSWTTAYENTFRHHFIRSSSTGQNDDRNTYKYNNGGERRDSGYLREVRQSPRKNVTRFEVVDDRVREDRFGGRRRYEIGKPPHDSKIGERHGSLDMSNLPVVRSVRDILGEDVPPLRVDESPKANGSQKNPGSSVLQRTAAPTNNVGTNNVKPDVEQKIESLGSLIDFDVDPQPPDVAAQPVNSQHGQPTVKSVPNPSVNGDNWGASLDFCNQPAQDSSTGNTLENIFSQISTPTVAPLHNVISSADSEFNPSLGWTPINQASNVSLSQNAQGTLTSSNEHPSHGHLSNQTIQKSQPSTDRGELPVDLFAATYSPVSVQPHGWQTCSSGSLRFGMQHLTPTTYFPQQSKSVNPFDVNTEPTLVHAPLFPTLALQGTLPQTENNPGLLRTSSLGPPSHNWTVPQTSTYGYKESLPSYPTSIPTGKFYLDFVSTVGTLRLSLTIF
ncbi:hypothetical protein MKW94_011929 [Papaver nudicaule]|uniref:Arf-GAP domain-containing protein n=1 Tax=Papaver nudicaule TaxID=74823 RepID=A0AA41SD36_PAPNU|nr:hypothetical protein [Papaver nudicaule]